MKGTEKNSHQRYDYVVYQRMRHILMSYRNLWRGSSSQKYEWGELASDIEAFCDIELPKNSLENFVRGWYEKSGKGKESAYEPEASSTQRFQKFSIPQNDRVEAIISFLTDQSSKGWFCNKEQLLEPPKLQAPFFLQEYLNYSEISKRCLVPEQFKGSYQSCYDGTEPSEDKEIPKCLSLHILESIGNGAVIVDLVQSNSYSHGNRTVSLEPIDDESELYSGWAVLSSEENLFVYTKHHRTDRNEFYLSLGFDNKIYSGSPPDALLLLKHDFPEDRISIESESDEPDLINVVKEDLLDKLFLLRRNSV